MMNSRERLLAALNHQEPDCVPFDLGSTQVPGIHAIAYRRLCRYLGLPPVEPTLCDVVQQLARPDDDDAFDNHRPLLIVRGARGECG